MSFNPEGFLSSEASVALRAGIVVLGGLGLALGIGSWLLFEPTDPADGALRLFITGLSGLIFTYGVSGKPA